MEYQHLDTYLLCTQMKVRKSVVRVQEATRQDMPMNVLLWIDEPMNVLRWTDKPLTLFGGTCKTMSPHQRAVRDRNTSTSALADHVCSTGHPVEWNKAQIIDSCPHTSKRCLLESWMIQKQPSTLNRELGPLPPVYRQFFRPAHPLMQVILCTYCALFSCTLVNCKLVSPTLFIH